MHSAERDFAQKQAIHRAIVSHFHKGDGYLGAATALMQSTPADDTDLCDEIREEVRGLMRKAIACYCDAVEARASRAALKPEE